METYNKCFASMMCLHSGIFLYSKITYIIYIAKMNYSPKKETTIQYQGRQHSTTVSALSLT